MRLTLPALALACLVALAPTAAADDGFELLDGDRVVFLGSTVVEREQRYGYWETALTAATPERNVTFRNLGWSGDTVWGEARASFDTPKEGYKRLVDLTLSQKPTVIFLGYGSNESFAGEAGLPRFREQLTKLLHDLAPSKARVVLLAPPLFEEATWKAGDLAARNRDLQLYTEALRDVARQRQLLATDEFAQRYGPAAPLTDNGMHFTAYGYWRTAGQLLTELWAQVPSQKLIELDGPDAKEVLQDVLVNPAVPQGPQTMDRQSDSMVIARGLKSGKYTLKIDGRSVHTADAATWMTPAKFGRVLVPIGPSLDQAEQLRMAIIEKNRLFFCRWRPQNETYLFGFRKQEQGQNAKEIPEFDPLVEQQEKQIARLRKPVKHTYQLVPAGEEKQ